MVGRIGLDARALNTAFVRGIGEYILPLVGRLNQDHAVDWVFYGHRPDLPFHRPVGCETARVVLRDVPGYRFHAWEQMALPARALFDRVSLLHCTATTMPLWQPVPTIVTIHGTIPWNTGESMAPGTYRDTLLPRAFRRCAAVITISHHSKGDILARWPDLASKIHVIHHGINDLFLNRMPVPLPEHLAGLGIDKPYLLYLGGTTPRKRLDWTLDLFQALGRDDIALVVCGVAVADHAAYRDRLPPNMRPNVVFAPFLAAEDMPTLYQNALAVLYPTLYEGFGRPALDAQAVGTPVLVSDVSSLRELVGPTSIALDPTDDAGWLQACRAVIARRIGAVNPDEASRVWARQFSWATSAERHWKVYRAVAPGIG